MKNFFSKNKSTIIDICLLILMTIFGFFSYFKSDINVGADLTYHLNRFAGLANAFEEGQILPKLYPFANNEFGYASPLFYCDIFLYPFAILYHYGVSAVLCYKICVAFYTLTGNIIVYLIIFKETNKRLVSLIASFLYFSSIYHLLNIFIRSSLGELIAYAFIPLVLHSMYKVFCKNDNCWIYLGTSFSLIFMSHNITSVLYGIFLIFALFGYIILHFHNKKSIKNLVFIITKSTLFGVMLSAWYLLPMIEQFLDQTFWININSSLNNINSTTQNLIDVFRVFIESDFSDISISSVSSIGLPIIILSIISLYKNNKYINMLIAYILFLYLILLGVFDAEILNFMQFYSRLYILIYPLSIICVVFLFNNLSDKKIIVLSVFLVIYGSINIFLANTSVLRGNYKLNNYSTLDEINQIVPYDKTKSDYNPNELAGAEYLPYTEYVNYNLDNKSIKVLDSNNVFIEYSYDYERSFTSIKFSTICMSDEIFMVPISYYKGYSTYELNDNKWNKINTTYSEKYKRITIEANEGSHTYMVKYDGTLIQNISLAMSTIGVCFLIFFKINSKLS